MWENIVKNWRTSGAGLLAAVAGMVALIYPENAAHINQIAAGVAILLAAIFALITKDSSVTGTALNPRAQLATELDPAPSPAAKVEIAVIEEAKKP